MGESRITLVLLTIVVKFSVIKALSPYPLIEIPCDAPCYKNRLLEEGAGANGSLVCGTNGVTYLNLEEMSCVRKSCKTDIRLLAYGRCPRLAPQDASDTNLSQFLSQMIQKPQTSYGQNYNSKYLSQKNEDEFSSILKVRKFPIQSRNGQKVCIPDECGCPDDLEPVCASDHVTYGSKCLLECNRNCNPDVLYNHDGYCGRLFFPKTSSKS